MKYTIPILLASTIIVAGIFAFMPVDEARTVHTTIQASTTKLVESTAEATTTGDGFRVTCPATSDGCIINEAFLIEENAAADADINNIEYEAPGSDDFNLAVEGDNTVLADDGIQAILGVSGFAMAANDVICFDVDGTAGATGDSYSLKVIATVEGDLTAITVVRIPNADDC